MEVLHLDYRPGTAGWVLPLQSRLQASPSATLRERYSRWAEVGLGEAGAAVATRLALTLRVTYRLVELLKALRDEIQESGEVAELLDGGYVYSTRDARIFYDLCVAVDAVFFEFRSCYEVIGRFIRLFGTHILGREISESELIDFLKAEGVNTEWIDPLRANRILFFHETAPWIALRVHARDPLECSVLVMKRNLDTFENPDDFVTQQQLVDTITDFQSASWRLSHWLDTQIEAFESQESRDSSET